MVDEETVTKVRNKSVLKFAPSEEKHADIMIYSVEVVCGENNIGDTICEGDGDIMSSEIVDEAIRMHDDGQDLVVERHQDHLQCHHSGGGEQPDPRGGMSIKTNMKEDMQVLTRQEVMNSSRGWRKCGETISGSTPPQWFAHTVAWNSYHTQKGGGVGLGNWVAY